MKRNNIEGREAFPVLSAKSAVATLVDFMEGILITLESWRRDHENSMKLARVEARVLQDIGVSEAQRFIALNKPFRGD
jgi:uncharacterized protein YjiS (DUF1127 family)